MRVFELRADGQLTKSITDEIGAEYSIKERFKEKVFGVGQLRYVSGSPILNDFYERHNQSVKAHFDWTKKGAVIRLRTLDKLYAIGLKDDLFRCVHLKKNPDYIYAALFSPFWILLKLGAPFQIAKWFVVVSGRFRKGNCEITIEHQNDIFLFVVSGDLWTDCLQTFNIDRTKDMLLIEDKRTWITDDGIKINRGRYK